MPEQGIDKALLGQILFFDTALSRNQTQNCSTCHNPDTAFVDLRENSAQKMVSAGDDPHLFGNRNSPTMLYAKYSPAFYFDEKTQQYIGGQFWDGRAKNLTEQAGGPPLNPLEMGMPSKLEVAKRLASLPMYVGLFMQHYGEDVWQSVDNVYAAMEDAIATFQQEKALLAPFDSKYDKFLRQEYQLTELEEKGRSLFFDKNQTNCSSCHQLQEENHAEETFSNYHYYNIGVPKNVALIAHNNLAPDFVDNGLLDNPRVNGDVAQKGKFKVPTLRNVAVTAPYMHNGLFKELKTVLLFLDHYNNPQRKINPETQQQWDAPEYEATLAHEDLKGKPLSDDQIEALEAFLKTLTDERYENLLQK
ncbi:MAG: c-type cytochrome [[Pasteurella] aerogenes]|nr:c-type cytochrome [[Pasteurella] aerogenes]MDY2797250.1 cytochrome c peroxidase [[Pasteurella] aerogenes]